MAKSRFIESLEEQYTKAGGKSVLRYKAPDGKWRYINSSKDDKGEKDPSLAPSDGGNVTFTDGSGNNHQLVTSASMPSVLADNQMIVTTWSELKALRDGGNLIAGSFYRITDYQCTTTQENTRSAGHQFDIVLLALSADKLAEEGWAMMNESNIYDVTFSDGVTKKCWAYNKDGTNYNIVDCTTLLGCGPTEILSEHINEENKTIVLTNDYEDVYSNDLIEENLTYNYFQNSKLEAWKVWYCLDNDTDRFAWADDSLDEDSPASISTEPRGEVCIYTRKQIDDIVVSDIQYYAWEGDENYRYPEIYTKSETPSVGDDTRVYDNGGMNADELVASFTPAHQGTGLPNGRGVIYRLIDEWNNDVCYDFKNIQYKTKLDSDGFYNINGDDSWTYSLNCYDVDNSICYDASVICATLVVSDMTLDCNNNFISCSIGDRKSTLQYNQIFTNYSFGDEITNSASFVKMFDSKNVRIGFGNNIRTYNCSSFDVKYEGDAIYIINKKVLTEN